MTNIDTERGRILAHARSLLQQASSLTPPSKTDEICGGTPTSDVDIARTEEICEGTLVSNVDIAGERMRGRSRPSLPKIVRKKPRKRFRGTPPPLPWGLDALPDGTLLSETETAAACRRAKSTLEVWRKDPDHPLKWRRVGGRILYEVPSIRAFLKGDDQ
jgi:hypothetical protein